MVDVSFEVCWPCLITGPNAGKRLLHRELPQGCGESGVDIANDKTRVP